MSRKPYSLSKQLLVATALALGASSVALADDNSMNPFTGDSYKYFNGGHTLGESTRFNRQVFSAVPADPSWRQSHPNGLIERELQALSSSDLSASASQLNPPVLASAPADPLQAPTGNPGHQEHWGRLVRPFFTIASRRASKRE